MFKNLTGYEIDSLPRVFNLTDGHAFRPWSPAEEAVIDRTPQFFKKFDRTMQVEIEKEYIRDFCRLGKQTFDPHALGYLMCPGSSMALEIIGNYLRLQDISLTLIEPCFDNLADICLRHRVPLVPFPDRLLDAPNPEFEAALAEVKTDAICFVTPNNPTGVAISEANFRSLVRFCGKHHKLLILDTCFRAYIPRDQLWDQYRIILESGVDAFIVEDTGKTWPTAELKGPFFAVTRARGFFDRICDIYTDFILHVSPVSIRLAHAFLQLSMEDDYHYVREVVRINRKMLYEQIQGTFLVPSERPYTSVAWLRINGPMTGNELKEILDKHGVFILSGDYFFWHDRSKGREFIRVALVRDHEMFAAAVKVLGDVVRKLAPSQSSWQKENMVRVIP